MISDPTTPPPESVSSRYAFAWLLLWLMPAMFAANHIVARAAVGTIEPHALAFARWLLALAILLPFAWRQLGQHRAVLRREWPDLLLLGVLGMWLCGALVYVGARNTVALNIALLFAAVPVVIVALSFLLYGERVRHLQVLGIGVCLAGVIAILTKGDLSRLLSVQFGIGDVWVGIAASSWALYTVLLRYRPSALDQTARLAAIMIGGLIAMVPATAYELAETGLPRFDLRTVGLIVTVALLPGIGAYWSFSFVLRELGAARAAIQMYVGPIYSAVLAWLLLGESLAWYHFLGAALILPGIWLATRSGRPT